VPTPLYITDLRRVYGHGLLLLPAVVGVVVDETAGSERLLLVRRSDNGRWTLPAGIMEPGEQPADALAREIAEEACVRVQPERLLLVTADPEMTYPNGDRCQFITLAFRCRYLGGEAAVGDEESSEVRWFPLGAPPELSEAHLRILRLASEPSGPTAFDMLARQGKGGEPAA
jgi:8-oxo-dGTP diphosphatase